MFTGIVETVGEITDVESEPEGVRLRVKVPFGDELKAGQSVSVSGVCLTVEDAGPRWFEVFLAVETREKSHLGEVQVGDAVNIERAMPVDGRFDGHIVQGHVDTTTTITGIESVGEDWEFEFSLPDSFSKYVVEKGSIAIDGISLTVAGLESDSFTVAIIPTTYRETTLASKSVGDPVNIEVDILAKYIERLINT